MSTNATNPPIVVGVDGSESALVALDWAADEAAANDWALLLVNAYEEAPLLPMIQAMTGLELARMILDEARSRVLARGYDTLDVSDLARRGSPKRVLLRAATRTDAHAIVLGREGSGQFEDLVFGSTSAACATHARLPVIVIPSAVHRSVPGQREITLGVDGSRRCQVAIEYAFTTASRWRARISAVFAVRVAVPALADEHVGDPDGRAAAAAILAEQLAPWRAKFPEVEVTESVVAGHPAAVIKEYGAEADLIVVGGRGHGKVTGMVLGSIVQAVLHHVDRPIAVVHEP